jgi:hypothetical protein
MSDLTARHDLREEMERLLRRSTLQDPIILSREFLCTALRRAIAGELQMQDLVAWANLVEAHDLIQYEERFEKLIANVVFCIASPEINGPLDHNRCSELIRELIPPSDAPS